MLIPTGGSVPTASTYMNFVYDPKIAAQIARERELHLARSSGAKARRSEDRSGRRGEPRSSSRPTTCSRRSHQNDPTMFTNPDYNEEVAGGPGPRSSARRMGSSSTGTEGSTPYLAARAGILWLAIFFLVPLGFLGYQSLQSGLVPRLRSSRGSSRTYSNGIRDLPRSRSCARSCTPGIATVASRSLLSYPLVYWIAFRGGPLEEPLPARSSSRRSSSRTSMRTLAWLNDPRRRGLRRRRRSRTSTSSAPTAAALATSFAVVAGITYNFLPFMALPLYVSLGADRPAPARGGAGPLRVSRRRRFCA